MRLATIMIDDGPRAAAVRRLASGEFEYIDLSRADERLPSSLRELLASPGALDGARKVAQSGKAISGAVRVLPPVPDPEKIICIGLNYADHAAETGAKVGDEPVVFCKFPTA